MSFSIFTYAPFVSASFLDDCQTCGRNRGQFKNLVPVVLVKVLSMAILLGRGTKSKNNTKRN